MRPCIKTVKDRILKSKIRHDIAVFSSACDRDRPDKLITRCVRFVSCSQGISPLALQKFFFAHSTVARTSVSVQYSEKNKLRRRIHNTLILKSGIVWVNRFMRRIYRRLAYGDGRWQWHFTTSFNLLVAIAMNYCNLRSRRSSWS